MTQIECDNCEKTFSVKPEEVAEKVACPFCGDINRMPESDGPVDKGLPSDHGPEQQICEIHPAMFRAHPLRGLAIVAAALGGVLLAIMAKWSDGTPSWLVWPGLLLVIGAVCSYGWWLIASHFWVKLTISNKRTVRQEGIIRRHTSEVLHDHVRNVEIRQNFAQRVLKVGYLGISSSGQEGIEIEVSDLPKPYELKALIDQYRKM